MIGVKVKSVDMWIPIEDVWDNWKNDPAENEKQNRRETTMQST